MPCVHKVKAKAPFSDGAGTPRHPHKISTSGQWFGQVPKMEQNEKADLEEESTGNILTLHNFYKCLMCGPRSDVEL
jgi:hypothetical protein